MSYQLCKQGQAELIELKIESNLNLINHLNKCIDCILRSTRKQRSKAKIARHIKDLLSEAQTNSRETGHFSSGEDATRLLSPFADI